MNQTNSTSSIPMEDYVKDHTADYNTVEQVKEFKWCNVEDPAFTFCPTCGVDVSIYSHENHCPYAATATSL